MSHHFDRFNIQVFFLDHNKDLSGACIHSQKSVAKVHKSNHIDILTLYDSIQPGFNT